MTAKEITLFERRHVDAILFDHLGDSYDWATFLKMWACRNPEKRNAGIKGSGLCLHPCAYTSGRRGRVPLYNPKDIGQFVTDTRSRFPHLRPGPVKPKKYMVDAEMLASPLIPSRWIEATPISS